MREKEAVEGERERGGRGWERKRRQRVGEKEAVEGERERGGRGWERKRR